MLCAVEFRFSGLRRVDGPATWSQLGMWRTILKAKPYNESLNCRFAVPVRSALSIDELVRVVGTVVSDYEALRTKYPLDTQGKLTQSVAQFGEMQIPIIQARQPTTASDALLEQLADTPFDDELDWPVRFTMIMNGNMPSELLVVLSPLSADWFAESMLRTEIGLRIAGRVQSPSHREAVHPIDRALEEHSPSVESRSRLATARWARFVDEFDVTNFPKRLSANRTASRWNIATLRSLDMASAALSIAKRCNAGLPAVYHAATAVMISALSDRPVSVMHNMSANRFSDTDMACMGRLTQASAAAVRVSDFTFDEVVQLASIAGIRSYAMGYYSTPEIDSLIDADLFDCFHNNIFHNGLRQRHSADDSLGIDTETGSSGIIECRPLEFSTHQFAVEVGHRGGQTEMSLLTDRCYLPVAQPDILLNVFETLIVKSAAAPRATPAVKLAQLALEKPPDVPNCADRRRRVTDHAASPRR